MRRVDFRGLHIQRNVEPNGSRPTLSHKDERPFKLAPNEERIGDTYRVFGQRSYDRYDVQLLRAQLPYPAILSQVGALDLARNEQDGRRFKPRSSQPRHGISGARP